MKSIKIMIKQKDKTYDIDMLQGQQLLSSLLHNEININGHCAGRGTCGKCNVHIVAGEYHHGGNQDKKLVGPSECFACQCYPVTDLMIEIPDTEEEFEILTTHSHQHHKDNIDNTRESKATYSIVVDLGTTTVVMQLIRVEAQKIMSTWAFVNPQRKRGADVISRITNANEGNELWFHQEILQSLSQGIQQLIWNANINERDLKNIVIAGNTTMLHFLRNYSVKKLGVHPFEPISLSMERLPFGQMFKDYKGELDSLKETSVILLPGISAFVGADITAGLYAMNIIESEGLNLLLDLGTNGEMAIGNKEGILATATAAGPAFEGGNIQCGTGSVPGAISSITIKRNNITYKTIGNKPPIGLCGTGVVELIAELLEHKYIDETGLLLEEYRDSGVVVAVSMEDQKNIALSQGDIRQMQLAKAAIRAGLDILMRKAGATYESIHKLYVAGGMGFHLDLKKAIKIGLLPEELEDKIEVIGNSCLSGTTKLLTDAVYENNIKQIISKSSYFNLANEDEFQRLFLQYMNF